MSSSKFFNLSFRIYLKQRSIISLGTVENKSDNIPNELRLNHLNSFQSDYFIRKLIKKSDRGLSGLIDKNDVDVGFALILNSDLEFNDAYTNKKEEVKKEVTTLDLVEELPNEIFCEKWKILQKNLLDKKEYTSKLILILIKAITVDNYNKNLLEKYIEAYCAKKAKIFKEEDPKNFEFYLNNKDHLNLEKKRKKNILIENIYDKVGFFTWKFEDFLLNFITLVKFFTGLKVTLNIEANSKVYIKFYSSEVVLKGLAESFEYDLQLKNYGKSYNRIYMELKDKQNLSKTENQSENSVLIDNSEGTQQFHNFNQEKQFNFPPYVNYEKCKNNKFRRYTRDDLFHECSNDRESVNLELMNETIKDSEPECCTNFRNIDRIRLIYRAFDEIILQKSLKEEYLDSVVFLRNYKTYKDSLVTK